MTTHFFFKLNKTIEKDKKEKKQERVKQIENQQLYYFCTFI